MDLKLRKKLVFRQAICWAVAIITPSIVMVVLDLFDKHTPNNIVLFSGIFLIAIFGFSNQQLQLVLNQMDKSSGEKS